MTAIIRFASMLMLCATFATGAAAQLGLPATGSTDSAPVLPEVLTVDAANALISRLSDTEVRALLLERLEAQAMKPGTEDAGVSEFFYHATSGAVQSITIPVRRLPLLFEKQGEVFATFYDRIGGFSGLLTLFGYMFVVFGAGAAAEVIFRRATRNWRILPPADPENMQLREVVQLLAQRLTTQVVAVIIFVLVSMTVGRTFLPDNILAIVSLVGPYLIGFPRFMLAIAFFLFAPMNPEYRLLNVDTKAARALCFHQFWIAFLLGFSGAILTFNAMHGLPQGETRLGFWLNLGFQIYILVLFWRYREAGQSMMRGFETEITPAEARVAQAYPYFVMVIIVAVWWVINIVVSYENFALLSSQPHYKTMLLLMFAPAMDTLIRGMVRHLSPPMTGEGAVAERAHASAKRSFVRIGRVVVFAIVIISIARF